MPSPSAPSGFARASHRLALVGLVSLLAPPIRAQLAWRDRSPYPTAAFAPLAYDSARAVTVLFGGDSPRLAVCGDTWEWNGGSWIHRTPSPSPSPRDGHALAYDSARRRTVLFGGLGSGFHADTWEYDGLRWTVRFPSAGPSPRSGHAMAYDSVRAVTVLFGGNSLAGKFQDTWEWDGTSWLQRAPASRPSARTAHGMAFDPVRGRTVLFGGLDANTNTRDDTWEWDGINWLLRATAQRPIARTNAGLVFDAMRGRILLFGGNTTGSIPANDTWEWDGAVWQQLQPATLPPPASAPGLVCDLQRSRVVLFCASFSNNTAATWEWDGVDWAPLTFAQRPAARSRHALVYDWERQCMVLAGGTLVFGNYPYPYTDTWELGFNRTSLGPGCAGSNGVPVLDTASVLRIGGSFTTELAGLASGAPLAIVVSGSSSAAWGATALPLDLTPLGMTGCSLRVRPDLISVLPLVGGRAALVLDVPLESSLVGRTLAQQGLSFDPRANAVGLAFSNAIVATIDR
jgi:hypothetical protein